MKFKLQLQYYIKAICWLLLSAVLSLSIILFSSLWLFTQLPQYEQQLENYLTEKWAYKVELKELKTAWHNNYLALDIAEINIADAEVLQAKELKLELDVVASVLQLQPVFARFDLAQLEFKMPVKAKAKSNQNTVLNPLAMGTGLTWLLDQQSINIEQIKLHLSDTKNTQLYIPKLRLESGTNIKQLKLNAMLEQAGEKSSLELIAEAEKSFWRPTTHIYAELNQLPKSFLHGWLKSLGIEAKQLEGQVNLWAKLRSQKLLSLQARTEFKTFKLKQQPVKKLSLALDIQPRFLGYQAQLTGQLDAISKTYQIPEIRAYWSRNLSLRPEQLETSFIGLSELSQTVQDFSLLTKAQIALVTELDPQGTLENISVIWSSSELDSFIIDADLKNVYWQAGLGIPAVKNLNGHLQQQADKGFLNIQSQTLDLDFPRLAWQKNLNGQAQGQLYWAFTEDELELSATRISLVNQELDLAGGFYLNIPYESSVPADFSLLIGAENSPWLKLKPYLPKSELGNKTYQLLTEDIFHLDVHQAGLSLTAQFGGDRKRQADTELQVFVDGKNLDFAFSKQWPELTKSKTSLYYDSRLGLVADVKGRWLDSKLTELWLYQPRRNYKLHILGQLQGDAKNIHQVLAQSPFAPNISSQLADISWSGLAQTDIELNIDLLAPNKMPDLAFNTNLKGVQLTYKSLDLSLRQLKGNLSFSNANGFNSKNLQGQIFGQPVQLKIHPFSSKNKLYNQVEFKGQVEVSTVQNWLQLPYPNLAKGKTAYEAYLNLCPANTSDQCNKLELTSNLSGIEINFPKLTKKAKEQAPFVLAYDFNQANSERLNLNYKNILQGDLIFKQGDFTAGRLAFNKPPSSVEIQPGLLLEAQFDQLDFSELEQLKGLLKPTAAQTIGASNPLINFAIERFTAKGFTLDNLKGNAVKTAGEWRFNLDANELKGEIVLPATTEPMFVNLDFLKIPQLSAKQGTGKKGRLNLPEANVYISQLWFDEKQYGDWQFAFRPKADQLNFERIQARFKNTDMTGQLSWQFKEQGKTQAKLEFNSEQPEQILTYLDYHDVISAKSIHLDTDMSWQGAPWQFLPTKFNGNLKLIAKEGFIKKGLNNSSLNVWGLLSLDNLGRRLSLDFTDVFSEGLSFDRLSTQYQFNQGVADTVEPFVLKGPSVDISWQGSLDLNTKTVDKDIKVMVPIIENISLLGGLLLSQPQIVGTVYLINKISGNSINKFNAVEYHLSGPWANPTLQLKKHE